jgi:hypothetical protein
MVIIKITLYLREKKYINILPITLFKFGAFGIFFFFFWSMLDRRHRMVHESGKKLTAIMLCIKFESYRNMCIRQYRLG